MDLNYAAHEMGHAYGLRDSEMILNGTVMGYGDKWTIMGSNNAWEFKGKIFGSSGPGLLAPNGDTGPGLCAPDLEALGWLPEGRTFTYGPSPDPTTIELMPLDATDLELDPRVYLMARIIKPDCVYTIDFRQSKGWDSGIPHSGVVIHKEGTLYHAGSKGWRRCVSCEGLASSSDGGPSGFCPALGDKHQYDGTDYSLGFAYSSLSGYPGQSGWQWCSKCQGLAYSPDRTGGTCPLGGGSHDFIGMLEYTLMYFENSIGQSGWRCCVASVKD